MLTLMSMLMYNLLMSVSDKCPDTRAICTGNILPEKFVKRRQNGENLFLWSHCCASCGVAVGNRFCLFRTERNENR